MEPNSRKRSLSPYSGRAAQSSTRKPPPSQNESRKPASGFKWKEKPRRDEDDIRNEPKGLERGYRDQEKPKRRETEAEHDPTGEKFGNSVTDKFGAAANDKVGDAKSTGNGVADKFGPDGDGKEVKREKKKKEKGSSGPRPTTEEMIIVNVNDRLGTKAAIPCLASDPISMYTLSPFFPHLDPMISVCF